MLENTEQKFNDVVNSVESDLDSVVEMLSKYRYPDQINNLTDEEIWCAILDIGFTLYNIVNRFETVGIKGDIAKILLDYRQNDIMISNL